MQFQHLYAYEPGWTRKKGKTNQKIEHGNIDRINFKFCTMLNGSTFEIPDHLDRKSLRRLIDTAAVEIMNKYKKGDMIQEEIKRFSCLMASMGENEFLRSVPTRLLGPKTNDTSMNRPLLKILNPSPYFPKLSVPISWELEGFNRTLLKRRRNLSIDNSEQKDKEKRATFHLSSKKEWTKHCKAVETRKHYKIVYFMLVHQDYEQLVKLLDLIYDPDGFYLLHVDERSKELYHGIQAHIHNRYYANGLCNLKVVSRWAVLWGGGSIILAQLDMFFQSLKLKYDYIINMSAYCIPLYSTSALHSLLRDRGYQSWMLVSRDSEPDRVEQVWIPNRTGWMTGLPQRREYKLDHEFPVWKQDQWMILSRRMVEWMNQTPDTYKLLAWFEHSFIPDEHYFATLIMKPFPHETFTGGVWYRVFEGDFHPKWLTKSDIERTLPHEFFARKVKLSENSDLIQLIRDKWDRAAA
jgi:hypothetical protein